MIKKNILANLVGRFWSIFSIFLFLPIYLDFLGIENYSIITYTLIIFALGVIIDSGLTTSLSRDFARADIKKPIKLKLLRSIESIYLLLIVVIIITLFSLSNYIAYNWINLTTVHPSDVSFLIKICSIDVGFQLLLRLYINGLLGLEEQVKANLYQIGWGIVRNGLVVIILFLKPTLEFFFIYQTIVTIIFVVLLRISLIKVLIGKYEFNFLFKIELSVLKNSWKFVVGVTIIALVAALNTQVDKLMIGKLLPIETLGYYSLAVSLAMGIMVLVNPISMALLPRFTKLYSLNEFKKASDLFHDYFSLAVILSFSAFSIMFFFSKEIITLWINNPDLADKSHIYLPILAFTGAMLAISLLPYNIAIAKGHTRIFKIGGITTLIITIPLYWFSIKLYGPIGSAYVYCLVQSIAVLVYINLINKKFINLKSTFKMYIHDLIFPFIISFTVAYMFSFIPIWAINNKLLLFSWISLAAVFCVCSSLFILVPIKKIKKIISN